ncbi:RNA polymerase-associated protein RapA [Lentisphaera profundi]|uniref:RNA polymerase-associated protein RapA n=1 Tax=Lentisphaera profundi TaxID=1658616 RepID=A0ABY7VPG7_9BACT|nr:RNA polymerase-associated protein RapA [Lentisphaera profundi]WDE96045.1 RNA polymerase-associated protein RapA [Lentisphaera profundi]
MMYKAGQRYFSKSEPELGLGVILKHEFGNLEVLFPATETRRLYVSESAPVKRVSLREGQIFDFEGEAFKIIEILEEDEGYIYINEKGDQVREFQLPNELSLSGPEDRLLAGNFDDAHLFDLRRRTLMHQSEQLGSEIYGFQGARLDLLPHQFYVADEVSSMVKARVLLADEVGLGKTIEAGLILHRLLLRGDVKRVLILLPDALQNQWFVEMYRKFNLWFSIIDEERFKVVEANPENPNPFLEESLIITSTAYASSSAKVSEAIVEGEWDLIIVDEAHHLSWSQDQVSREYSLVEELAKRVERLILLTATPDQLGEESHFARLRLLDPDRFYDLEVFKKEQENYRSKVKGIDKLLYADSLSKTDFQLCETLLGKDHPLLSRLKKENYEGKIRHDLLRELIDRHGSSRIIFRNTRKVMENFPVRCPQAIELAKESRQYTRQGAQAILEEVDSDLFVQPGNNLKIQWICETLKAKADEKFLLICSSREKAEAIEKGIREHMDLKMVVFHEGLSLNQRDRNAVFFSQDLGARLLICSEIGSEGRNFQFCQNLILFDLPMNPGLLEQRIGRLDRIGQTSDIQIFYPYRKESVESVLADFYSQGLDAFARPLHGGEKMTQELRPSLEEVIIQRAENMEGADKALSALISLAKKLAKETKEQLEEGRDHLLELYSFDADRGLEICQQLRKSDRAGDLFSYLEDLFDYLGVDFRDVDDAVYKIEPGQNLLCDLPGLNSEGKLIATQRAETLKREDVALMTWEHPLLRAGMDIVASGEAGNNCFALCVDPSSRSIILEAVLVLECLLPAKSGINRFLPPTPIFVRVDHRGRNITDESPFKEEDLEAGDAERLLDKKAVKKQLVPEMLRKTQKIALEKSQDLLKQAEAKVKTHFENEIARLKTLKEKNDFISDAELSELESAYQLLVVEIPKARLRQDSLRLIWKGSENYLDA